MTTQGHVLRELSLFSGLCGFTLGLRLAGLSIRTVGYCDNEPYIQRLIQARIKDGLLDDAPIIGDIRAFDFSVYRGLVDIITAGFPCQPHSVAGKRAGALDDRNLWPDTLRVIDAVGPAIVLLENVPGILANGYAGTVVGELAERGYDAFWGLLSASSIGAPHVRTRWWCLAYPNRFRAAKSGWRGDCLGAFLGEISERRNQADSSYEGTNFDNGGREVENPQKQRLEGGDNGNTWFYSEPPGLFPPGPGEHELWASITESKPTLEPALRGVANGPAHRVDRLKAIGNGVVPAVVAEFLRRVKLAE